MSGSSSIWERMKRMGRANEEARDRYLASLTLEKAAQMVERILSCPAVPPRHHTDHPESLAHRLRRGHA